MQRLPGAEILNDSPVNVEQALAIVCSRRDHLVQFQQGFSPKEVEIQLFWDALVVNMMKKWR